MNVNVNFDYFVISHALTLVVSEQQLSFAKSRDYMFINYLTFIAEIYPYSLSIFIQFRLVGLRCDIIANSL